MGSRLIKFLTAFRPYGLFSAELKDIKKILSYTLQIGIRAR
jgi:hypothetical protein